MPRVGRFRAIVMLVVVNVLWGLSFPSIALVNRVMNQALPGPAVGESATQVIARQTARSSFFMVCRFSLAIVALRLIVPRCFRVMTRRDWAMGMIVGTPCSLGFLLQVVGLSEIPASRSGFLTSLSVVFTPLLMVALERKIPRAQVLLGAALALFGTTVLTGLVEFGGGLGLRLSSSASSRLAVGDWLTLAAALLFSFQIILLDVFADKTPSERLTPGMFLMLALMAIPCFALANWLAPPLEGASAWVALARNGPFIGLTLLTCVFCSVFAFSLMNMYQPGVSPAEASVVYSLEPICATLWAMWLPGVVSPLVGAVYESERPSMVFAAGGALVLLGNVVSLLRTPGKT